MGSFYPAVPTCEPVPVCTEVCYQIDNINENAILFLAMGMLKRSV